MEKPHHCSDTFFMLMMECWNENPNHRPTFDKLLSSLSDFQENRKFAGETFIDLTKLFDKSSQEMKR
jgi:Protein tyrosine and serine/threonine kinase